jgi:multidrug efflux pump subunit AcrA (membrane-fusion protein)
LLEKDSAGVEVDSAATITIDARPGHVFHGKVKSIAEISRPIERDSPVKYSELKITLEDAGPDLLKPGMKGEARIITGHAENALVLPRSALRGEPENPFVLVRAGAAIQRRPVKLGPGDQVRITILEGIEEGEMVLLGGESSEPESLPADEDPASQTAGETATGI